MEVEVQECYLHSSIRHLMRICRWIGYFPVEGLGSTGIEFIRFNIRTVYGVYYVTTIIGVILTTILCFLFFILENYSMKYVSSISFSLNGFILMIFLHKLAQVWPTLMKTILDTERNLTAITFPKYGPIKTATLIYGILFLAMFEHICSNLFYGRLVFSCFENIESEVIERFLTYRIAYVFRFFPYSMWIGILSYWFHFQVTFLWSFSDILVISFSIYLTTYFKSLGEAINSTNVKDWGQLRLCYSRLVMLVSLINNQLSRFIFLSSLTNLFEICLKFFHILHRNYFYKQVCGPVVPNVSEESTILLVREYMLYFGTSLTYLIIRSLIMFFWAANVNASAKKAVLTLYEIPSKEFNVEVHRFQLQARYTTVGLHGIFFTIERGTILRVIATVITYELVMLQFSHKEELIESQSHNVTTTRNISWEEVNGQWPW